jgi:hypothetical protein
MQKRRWCCKHHCSDGSHSYTGLHPLSAGLEHAIERQWQCKHRY